MDACRIGRRIRVVTMAPTDGSAADLGRAPGADFRSRRLLAASYVASKRTVS